VIGPRTAEIGVIEGLDRVEVITVFVEDLESAKAFYGGAFGLETVYEDDNSAVVALDNLMINLLVVAEADTPVEPRTAGGSDSGPSPVGGQPRCRPRRFCR
jgi:catechol 2,3-dioxygenase-like lactoylglutathione lyase family enzyme